MSNKCPFTKEDYENNPKRKEGMMSTKGLKEYFSNCRDKGIKDDISGFIVGWTAQKVKEFMGKLK